MKHAYTPLNETIQDGCDVSLFQREALWWNRAVRSLVILALLSVTTWAVLRANENGALSDLFSSAGSSSSRDAADVDVTVAPPKAPVSLTDNDLQHQWNTYEEGEWSTSTTTTPTTPARDGGLYAVATNEYSHLNNKLFPYPFLDDGILVEPFKEVRRRNADAAAPHPCDSSIIHAHAVCSPPPPTPPSTDEDHHLRDARQHVLLVCREERRHPCRLPRVV